MARQHVDPLACESARQLAPEVGVHAGEQSLRHLDHGHLGAEGGVDVRELDAHRPAADDHDRRGQQRPLERLAAGEHDLAVDLEPGQGLLAAPAGEEDEARAEPLAVDRHVAAHEPARPVVVRDPVLLEQELDALRLPVGDLARARDDARVVDAQVVGEDAASGAALHLREERRVGEDRLRRNAAPVAAHAAGPVALDDRGAQPELRGADGRHVAARAGAEDDQVVVARAAHRTSASGFSSSPFSSPRKRPASTPSMMR